jgi:hypothetical protein
MSKAHVWKTQDGRVIPMKLMTDAHLENTIRYLEVRGVEAAALTDEQRAEDPVANAEFLMGSAIRDIDVEKYRQLKAERERRRAQVEATRLVMAVTRPGPRDGRGTPGGGRQGGGVDDGEGAAEGVHLPDQR